MTPRQLQKLDQELRTFVAELIRGMGRPERREAMQSYIYGLLLDGERKSMEPIAARLVSDPSEVVAMRQRLQECISVSTWDERETFRRLALKLDAELPEVEALVVDDTGFPKKGKASVGVARQYSGTLGRVDNCQVATSLHLAGERGSGCIGLRLYLPSSWTDDRERCRRAHVPDTVEFEEKWRLALRLIDDALAWGVRKHVVLADCAYGDVGDFRDALTQRGLPYVLGVSCKLAIWPPGVDLSPPPRTPHTMGAPRLRPPDEIKPMSVLEAVQAQSRSAWRTVSWRDGSQGKQSSRFLAMRVRLAHQGTRRSVREPQWLLAEWPRGEAEPTKFYLSNLPENTSTRTLVRFAKLRWRVERDYQEMKGELGLDHFEGRFWSGFHHHAALVALAHAFLSLQRTLFPPQDPTLDPTHGPTRPSAGPLVLDRLLSALQA